jgi:WD40 repeat protein
MAPLALASLLGAVLWLMQLAGTPQPQARTDAIGDPLPPHARARFGTVRAGDFFRAAGLTISPDGKLLASGDSERLDIWDAATGQLLRVVPGNFNLGRLSLAFSPDGTMLAAQTARPGKIALHELATGKVLATLTAPGDLNGPVAFAPCGKLVASAVDGKGVCVWDRATAKAVALLPHQEAGVTSLAFSADGDRLAAVFRSGALHVWDVRNGKRVGAVGPAPQKPLAAAALSPRWDLLAVPGEREIRVVEVAGGKQRHALAVPDKGPLRQVWFAADGNTLFALSCPDSGPPQALVSAWEVASRKRTYRFQLAHFVWQLLASPDDSTWTGFAGDRLRRWDARTGKELPMCDVPYRPLNAVAVTPDGRTAAVATGFSEVMFWDTLRGARGPVLHVLGANLGPLAISPDGTTLVAGGKRLRFWDITSRKLLRTIDAEDNDDGAGSYLAFAPDGMTVAWLRSGQSLSLYNVADVKLVRRWEFDDRYCWGLCFSPDGATLAYAAVQIVEEKDERRWLELLDVATGKIRRVKGLVPLRGRVAFSPDGRLLAASHRTTSAFGEARVYELMSGDLVWSEQAEHTHDVGDATCLAFSVDSRTLVTGHHDGGVRWWESLSGELRRHWAGHGSAVNDLALAADGRTLVTVSNDTTALAWDVPAHRSPAALPLAEKELRACWALLADAEAARAWDGLRRLVAAGDGAVAWLRSRLRPVAPDPAVARWLRELDDPRFAVRERASAELVKCGQRAVPALRARLEQPLPLEVRRRIEQVLARIQPVENSPELRQAVRAVAVLECHGSPAARQLLQELAGGAAGARLTREAQAALRRLAAARS